MRDGVLRPSTETVGGPHLVPVPPWIRIQGLRSRLDITHVYLCCFGPINALLLLSVNLDEERKLLEMRRKGLPFGDWGAERNAIQGRRVLVGEVLRKAGRVHTGWSYALVLIWAISWTTFWVTWILPWLEDVGKGGRSKRREV
jgi:hypothetical protein